ncbi:hypothetical protein JMN32_03300 [Fulvivirga sp. 29W222]|uniref:DinB-like domain-containing protein n=1 Tax=Fulvivirga marina TaxID=2494733 RepID=A0A937FUN6_9BACT|nr:hypothetical protein [Fulvivirga marina]MBL6445318.1 hypothetical protein [Fulvivirga marina]
MLKKTSNSINASAEEEVARALELLQSKVEAVADIFNSSLDFDQMVYPLWSAKDVLGHLVFWHESFARNLKDVSAKRKPDLLKGSLAEVNRQSVDLNRTVSVQNLLERLRGAQKTICNHIFDSSVTLIPYKKGSRSYSRLEHLEVVINHLSKHVKDLNQKLCPDQKTKKS